MTRELDDLILDLRTNEPELGTWVLKTAGDPGRVLAYDRLLLEHSGDWLANEIVHYLKRTLQAARRDQPQPDRADRAGQLLRRVAARARAGRRPLASCCPGCSRMTTRTPRPAAVTVGRR